LYADKRFDNALNYDAMGEVLALVARMNNDIAAIVAVDDYNYGLWQIGIDTVDLYRGKGLAAYLVKEIALESERRNQVPFYTTWSANIASTRTAIAAGFVPVWIGYFAG
jgi:GNAT superfamily N-acetyltransferase